MIEVLDSLFINMYENEKPIVAAVNGIELRGGYELVQLTSMLHAPCNGSGLSGEIFDAAKMN